MIGVRVTQPKWMRGFLIFWRITLIVALIFGVLDAVGDDPTLLHSWRGGALVLLTLGFIVFYELFERSEIRRGWHWPSPYRHVLLYLIAQFAIEIALLHFSFAFVGPIFALMGQVFSS